MNLPTRYQPAAVEPQLQQKWLEAGVYEFCPQETPPKPVYAIDTPPPTVSGHLHLGHCYSYSHPDFMARFWRMNGYSVFYPMGYDDNGLPTERLVERRLGITADQVGREQFITACLDISQEAEKDYQALWQRLGLSIDWRYTYRTTDRLSRRTSQLSFLDLYRKGLAYRQRAPTIWCPECNTAIAQAELNDLDRESEFITLAFALDDGETLPIATTRPELLPACVAVFVHPDDERYRDLVGRQVRVPLFGQRVPLLHDPAADPAKGTGVVMCCTFGDVTDVGWWYQHQLPLVEAIGADGRLTAAAGDFAGLRVPDARAGITAALDSAGHLLNRQAVSQSVRVHERCDTPTEYTVTHQWFIKVLDFRDQFLAAGEEIVWHPPHMKARYRAWVENLHWDWCISRQRCFGVPFPLWYCAACGAIALADDQQLPIDPADHQPDSACECGASAWIPEKDVMDTWATSSLTPQIVGHWLADDELYGRVFPMSLRPQAHEIIRTWAFYTIVKSYHHFGTLPWKEIAISGWGLAPEGTGKISKSRGGGPMAPLEMIERYSADGVRYWAACTGFGKDSIISEEKIQMGARLVTKLWNVARFSQRFLADFQPPSQPPPLSPADRWILSRAQELIARVTDSFRDYQYVTAKNEAESFLWGDLADNYLEMAKQRLYDDAHAGQAGAQYALHQVLLTVIKLLAPLLPHVTEQIYLGLFAATEGQESIHVSNWPQVDDSLIDPQAEAAGSALVEVATAVRRYKSEHNLPLGAELRVLQIAAEESSLLETLQEAVADLTSIARASEVRVGPRLDPELQVILAEGAVSAALAP
jgi:valyl-tRNA synthetase